MGTHMHSGRDGYRRVSAIRDGQSLVMTKHLKHRLRANEKLPLVTKERADRCG